MQSNIKVLHQIPLVLACIGDIMEKELFVASLFEGELAHAVRDYTSRTGVTRSSLIKAAVAEYLKMNVGVKA